MREVWRYFTAGVDDIHRVRDQGSSALLLHHAQHTHTSWTSWFSEAAWVPAILSAFQPTGHSPDVARDSHTFVSLART